MRLLHSSSLELKDFADSVPPRYAILSHLWGPDEATIEDFRGSRNISDLLSHGHHKIKNCCMQAQRDGIQWVWIDSCCVDRSIRDELSDTINLMYKWLENSHVCYAYLSTVSSAVGQIMPTFEQFKWFHRKWTLQKLVAPPSVVFFAEDCLCEHIADLTGIDSAVLRGSDPTERTVAERMSWAASRSTTRVEDAAYCLMGLFNVFMPMLYGEGSRAFTRLQEEIMRQSEDYTIFAWTASFMSGNRQEVRFRNNRIYVLPYGTQSEEDTYDMDRTRSG
ncbi:heterokaryon incompatibility protein-domain-containing protein [Leptodontidium sp. 2 PMI_412]|nr:heterokaryon incompatibility protein-domain-containing protein [Leptodontidium sp. 2 PMI_412]